MLAQSVFLCDKLPIEKNVFINFHDFLMLPKLHLTQLGHRETRRKHIQGLCTSIQFMIHQIFLSHAIGLNTSSHQAKTGECQ